MNVSDFGAKGDGVADDTAAINAALDAASKTSTIIFPAGTYKITGPLPKYWMYDHFGPGIITDGTNQYRVTPGYFGDLNTLWVNSATGSDLNDGLLPGTALKSLTGLMNRFSRMGNDMRRGNWKIRLSGTFDGATIYGINITRTSLTFEGDPLDATGKPTTLIRQSTAGELFGIRFEPALGASVAVKQIAFSGFKDRNGGIGGSGLIMKDRGSLDVTDCTFTDCAGGVNAVNNVQFSGIRLKAYDCTTGFAAVYSSSGAWHECEAYRCQAGFRTSRSAVVHVDYAKIENCDTAIEVSQNSRVGTIGGSFKRNAVVYKALGGSEYIVDYLTAPVNWHEGTADKNTQIYYNRGVSRETRVYGQDATNEFRTQWKVDTHRQTGVTTETEYFRFGSGGRIPAYYLADKDKGIRWSITGEARNSRNTATITVYRIDDAGANPVVLASQVFAAGETGNFVWEGAIRPYQGVQNVVSGKQTTLRHNAPVSVRHIFINNALLNPVITRLKVTVQVADAVDILDLTAAEFYMIG